MDTRFWGPSGWKLFHTVAKNPDSKDLLLGLKDVLPCKFCRQSTSKFTNQIPFVNAERWIYDLHNKVNHKLRTQCKYNAKVQDPGPDPSFESVHEKFEHFHEKGLGADFLFSVATNFTPTSRRTEIQRKFLHDLAKVYPDPMFSKFYHQNPPTLETTEEYKRWMFELLSSLKPMPSYTDYSAKVESFKSSCKKITCRKKKSKKFTRRNRSF